MTQKHLGLGKSVPDKKVSLGADGDDQARLAKVTG